jgi:glycosyltransferase involved in cell wall biosynthesis
MKILLVTDELLPGGVSRYVTDVANKLSSRGLAVTVASTGGSFRTRLNSSVRFVPLTLMKPNSYRKDYGGIPRSLIELASFVRQTLPDVIHTNKRFCDTLGRLVARKFGIPHVSTCHNTFAGGQWYSPFGDYTIAVSDAIGHMLISRFGKPPQKVFTIKNEIEPLRSASLGENKAWALKLGIQRFKTVIASVGQFIPSKDRDTLLDALAILNRQGKLKNTVCILMGHGQCFERLKARITQLALDEHVRFLPGEFDVRTIVSLADFCVLSSIQDGGIPYVLLEAASLKKPHIATNVGGIPEFISHGETGLLVPPKSPQLLAEAIEVFLRKPDSVSKIGRNAKNRFLRFHSSETYITETLEVYRRAISSRNMK